MSRALLAVLAFLLVTGCSGSLQGPPVFEQTYGAVDEPCASSKLIAAHCTAHVYLINHGGEGVALVKIAVPVKDPSAAASAARSNASVRCGAYAPDTPAGAEADLSCAFDLPVGMVVGGPPTLVAITFSAGTSAGGSGAGVLGAIDLGLAVLAALIAVAALGLAVMRRNAYGPANGPGHGSRPQPSETDEDEW